MGFVKKPAPALVTSDRAGPDIEEVHDEERRAILPPGRREPEVDLDDNVQVIDISGEREDASSLRVDEPLLPELGGQ